MAEEGENNQAASDGGGGDDGGAPKCPDCPAGLPAWMATFSDLVTLLLTFFVLLLSFAKTESAKYDAALGSIREAIGGNVLKQGEVIQRGKSPDDYPTMMESQEPIRPFPIEFLTMEGILDKHEINRSSEEDLNSMKSDLKDYDLSQEVTIYEQPEGIKVEFKDKIYFRQGSTELLDEGVSVPVLARLLSLLKSKDWVVFVQGHASRGEVSTDGSKDAFLLSSERAAVVARMLIKQGIRPEKITTVFYGDTRPIKIPGQSESVALKDSRRVDFILRKTDLGYDGHKVDAE